MEKNDHIFSCPIGETLAMIGGKWKPEILWYLADQAMRFNQLQRAIGGVSQKMLTQQLRELQRDGLVQRRQYEEIPLRVEYAQTELVDSLKPLFDSIVKWGKQHRKDIYKARLNYDSMHQ
jgi:DNA-binding HxlR family transcriptional regulator